MPAQWLQWWTGEYGGMQGPLLVDLTLLSMHTCFPSLVLPWSFCAEGDPWLQREVCQPCRGLLMDWKCFHFGGGWVEPSPRRNILMFVFGVHVAYLREWGPRETVGRDGEMGEREGDRGEKWEGKTELEREGIIQMIQFQDHLGKCDYRLLPCPLQCGTKIASKEVIMIWVSPCFDNS